MFFISMIGICGLTLRSTPCLHINQLHAVMWRRCVLCTVKKETTHILINQLFKRSLSKSLHQEGRTRTYTHYSGICTRYKKSNYLENSVEECRPQSVACLYHLRVNFLFGCCKDNNLELTGAIQNWKS